MILFTDYIQDNQPKIEDQIVEISQSKNKIAYELRKRSRKTQRSTELTGCLYIDNLKESQDKKKLK